MSSQPAFKLGLLSYVNTSSYKQRWCRPVFFTLFLPLWAERGSGLWWELGWQRLTGWEGGEKKTTTKWGWEEMLTRTGLVGEGRRLLVQGAMRKRRKRRGQAGGERSVAVSHPALDETLRSAALWGGLLGPLHSWRPWWVKPSPCCPSAPCALKTSSLPPSWTAWSPGPAGLQQNRVQWIRRAALSQTGWFFGNLKTQRLSRGPKKWAH